MTTPPWPVTIVTGMLGSGKTTLIRRLLSHPAARNTLVLVNEFGEIGLDHLLLRAVTDEVVLLSNGCLCCTVRHDIVRSLTDLRRDWLAGRIETLERVVIETSGLAEPAPLVASLLTHPLLVECFALRAVTAVVDGEHGCAQIEREATCRNQIQAADHLLVSKLDRIERTSIWPLLKALRRVNPLALIGSGARSAFEEVLETAASRMRRSPRMCDEISPHLDQTTTIVLTARGVVSWTAFRTWAGTLLEDCGDRLVRLKGCLRLDTSDQPIVLQAVHHAFYPPSELPGPSFRPEDGFLVLILNGPCPPGLSDGAAKVGLHVTLER